MSWGRGNVQARDRSKGLRNDNEESERSTALEFGRNCNSGDDC